MPIDSLVWYFKSMEDFNCVINKTNNIFHFSNTSHVIFPWINVITSCTVLATKNTPQYPAEIAE